MKRILLLMMCSVLFSACEDKDEEINGGDSMRLSIDACTLSDDKTYVIIDILDGGGEYKVQTSDEKVAVPFIEDEILYIMGFGKGKATVDITDQNNRSAEVQVVIDSEITRPLPLVEPVYVKKGDTKKLDAPFDFNHPAAFFSEEYISVFGEDSYLHIEGKDIGRANIYVMKDIWPIHIFDARIVEVYDLILESEELSVFVGQDVKHVIEVGNGRYSAQSTDPLVAEASIIPYEGKVTNSMSNPAMIKINPLQEGNAVISITDAESKTKEVRLEVKL